MAQAGLDHHKEAALQHAVRSYAVAERKGVRHDVPDPPSFARPAIEPRGPGGSDVAARPQTRRVLLTSETRSVGWKPRVRLRLAWTCVLARRSFSVCAWGDALLASLQCPLCLLMHVQRQWSPHTDLSGRAR